MRPEGRLSDRDFPDLIQELHEQRWTGVLTLTHQGIGKSVSVSQGSLTFASSTDPDDRLGDLLLRRGELAFQQLVDASKTAKGAKRLGGVLVAQGVLAPEALVAAVTFQVEQILYSLFQWTEGHYRLQPGPASSESITLRLSTPDIIMEGIRRIDAWSRIERGVGDIATKYARTEGYEAALSQMTLSSERLSLLSDLEGVRDVEEICRGSRLPDFETCRTLWAFRVIGIVRRAEPPAAPVVEVQAVEPSVELPAEEPEPAGPPRKRILVVGLEQELFGKIDPLLSRSLFAVQRVAEAAEAVSLCARAGFDLIVARFPLSGLPLKELVSTVCRQGTPCAAAHVLVLADGPGLGEARANVRDGVDLALPVGEPGKLLEEVASRLLGVAPRTSARLLVRLEVQLDEGKRLVMNQTENVSETGMLVRSQQLYAIGTRVAFESQPPGERAPIQGEAEVVRHTLSDLEGVQGMGLRFLGFRADGLKRLQDFVARAARSA